MRLELLDLLAREPEGEGELAALKRHQAGGRMHRDREDLLGRLLGDLLDLHAARARGHHRDAAALAVERETQVQLALDLRARLDIDVLDRQARAPGLLGDQTLTEHRARRGAHRLEIARELDAAGLAAAAGMHLSLDDP